MKLTAPQKATTIIHRKARSLGIPCERLNRETLKFEYMTDTLKSYIRGVLQVK